MPLPKRRSKSAFRHAPRPRSAQPSPRPLARLWRTFLTGLVAVIPLGVTVYVVYWLFSAADSLFSGVGQRLLPPGWYFPGLGLIIAVLVVLGLGATLNVWDFGRLTLKVGDRLLERIPLVKTVYGGVRDLMLFVS